MHCLVQMSGAARYSAKKQGEKYRARIAKLRELIQFLRHGR